MPLTSQTINNAVLKLNNASSTTVTALFTAGSNGSKIDFISIASTDTSDRSVAVYLTISGVDYLMGTVLIPLTAGFVATVPTLSLLEDANFPNLRLASSGDPFIYLEAGAILKVGMLVAITAAKEITFIVQGEDY